MLLIFFKDIFVFSPFLLYFIFFWIFFLKNNFLSTRINSFNYDKNKNAKTIKKVHYNFFNNLIYINFFYLFIFIFFIRLDYNIFWFNHLKINNFLLYFILIITALYILFFSIINLLNNQNNNYNIDYFSALANLACITPLFFLSNTIYTFLFLLELISLIILYKFSVSRNWFSINNSKKNNFFRLLPKSYLNMLFFQYWTNFFSSMFIMFSIFNLIFIFGSSDWVFLEVLCKNNLNYSKNNFFIFYILFLFLTGFFLKIGFSPIHLFKIEIYKGIPFISIFFYTSIYFISFFLYFIIIIYYNFNSLHSYYNIIFFLFIFFGLFYSIILLFDVNLIKSFFAYSTIVNATNFIIVLYLLIN